MSKFTTETRYICETYSGVTSGNINECIEKSISYIFSDDWNTYNPNHKQELCKKILKHYYLSEIGFETVGLWKLNLNEMLSEIMPKYNIMYQALEAVNNKIFNNVETTETRELTGKQSTTANSSNTSESASKTDSSGTNSGKTDSNNSSSSKTSGESTGNSDGWQESNDTPQGGLDGIESRKYLSNAVHNRSNTSGSQSQNASANGENHQTSTAANESHETGEQSTNSTGHSSGSSDTSENYTLKISGKNSGSSYLDELLKVQSEYNDIDLMIINDLNVCFMGLWE